MGRTKKVGITGRYGVRYGRKVKVAINKIEQKQKQKHTCPVCKKDSVKRVVAGIWQCRKCSAKFSGGAYEPKTSGDI
ncbi:MAG: 50S ribosomal protein L37Ae [Candidatus Aenigmarchaeota archaeon]|nr:50S ribosomal protein L37Ae [Candidatus Aenigmarchaeota archaeon]